MDVRPWSTGDLLMFSGSGWWDTLIKWWTRSDFSHGGMLDLSTPTLPILIHATPDRGVAPMDAEYAIAKEGGRCFWVSVKPGLALSMNPNYQADLVRFMQRHYGDGYDWGGIAHVVFPFIKRWKNHEFCFELIVKAFQSARLIAPSSPLTGNLVRQPVFTPPQEVAP